MRVNQASVDGAVQVRPTSIYILPTGFGILYAVLTFLMLIGAINYANNLAFLLTFFLIAMGLVGMIYTWRNLADLRLRPLKSEPVFAGQTACFTLQLEDPHGRARPDIELVHQNSHHAACDLLQGGDNRLILELAVRRRGIFRLGRCVLSSRYPLGLFRAWSHLEFQAGCLIYPQPEVWSYQLFSSKIDDSDGQMAVRDPGGQEFHGLRQYQPGDPLKAIHWRSLARGAELMSREFESTQQNDLWLDLEHTPGPDQESRLRQLCYAAVQLSADNLRFGLRLGKQTLEPDNSDRHLLLVLRSLALFGLEGAA